MLSMLGAINALQGATLVCIVEATGIGKKTAISLVEQARSQAAVKIEKDGPVYRILDWGPVTKQKGAKMFLTGALNEKYGEVQH